MQNWLQEAAEGASPTEDELVSSSRHQDGLVEPGFDTSDAAIFSEEFTESTRDAFKPIVWRRVTGLLVVPTQHYSRLVQVRGCGMVQHVCFTIRAEVCADQGSTSAHAAKPVAVLTNSVV